MKERPILFSGAMVRAILAGTKTQTRRVAMLSRTANPTGDLRVPDIYTRPSVGMHRYDNDLPMAFGAMFYTDGGVDVFVRCPYGVPGDRLWVRETFCTAGDTEDRVPRWTMYRADFPDGNPPAEPGSTFAGWRPSIFMPRAASRITLEVVSVRVERLQDISEADALAEGVGEYGCVGNFIARFDPRLLYEALWDKINGKRAPWRSNPWVWVVEFRRLVNP